MMCGYPARGMFGVEHRVRDQLADVVVLQPKDRGCTRPGCDAPGYRCEVHHLDQWADGGQTNIDKLTQACPPDHKLLDEGWGVRARADGAAGAASTLTNPPSSD